MQVMVLSYTQLFGSQTQYIYMDLFLLLFLNDINILNGWIDQEDLGRCELRYVQDNIYKLSTPVYRVPCHT